MSFDGKAKYVSKCLELAILLEASADKPGNVNRTNGFERTRYEHFLASAVAMASSLELAAERGIEVSEAKLRVDNVRVGEIIRDCVVNVNTWQRGGNTLLGTSILLSPIAVAAGMTVVKESAFDVHGLRENLKNVVESTTPKDAVDVYEAIKTAKPGGLGSSSELDVNDPNSSDKILNEEISLYEVFKIASAYDSICSEWVSSYSVTFNVAYPLLMGQLRRNGNLNSAVVHTFLKVLAEYPDTLIARKTNAEKSRDISSRAKEILSLGGLETAEGKRSLTKFDLGLRETSNLLNPGTTADIIAAALALCILSGYRP
jgi:triphosphoribosyl-dephospho-CoA synthase